MQVPTYVPFFKNNRIYHTIILKMYVTDVLRTSVMSFVSFDLMSAQEGSRMILLLKILTGHYNINTDRMMMHTWISFILRS